MFIDEKLASIATGRSESFFAEDFSRLSDEIRRQYAGKSVLVIGGAGTIGASCVREILEFRPERLDVVDINENGLSNLTRAIRSDPKLTSVAKMNFNALDCGSWAMKALIREFGPWDMVLNFSAVKHVRSEKNFATILHMLDVNVIKQVRTYEMLLEAGSADNYFVVSTDKPADPSNLVGARKRLLEWFVFRRFLQRLQRGVPLGCPDATQRYFISPREAAHICLIGQVAGLARTMIVPRMEPKEHLVELKDVARRFLDYHGLVPVFVEDEAEAYHLLKTDRSSRYPVILTPRNTAGEKQYERFVGDQEKALEIGLASLLAVEAEIPTPELTDAGIEKLDAIVSGQDKSASISDVHDFVTTHVPTFDHIPGTNRLDDRI